MFVLSLCKQLCPSALQAFDIGERLGDGADGEAFTLLNEPTKVLKLSVLYERDNDIWKLYNKIQGSISYIMDAHPPMYVRVYEQGYLGDHARKVAYEDKLQKFILFYYVMEKLNKISEDEKKVFHSILSHEDRGIEKLFAQGKVSDMLRGMSHGLDFDLEKVMMFHQSVMSSPIHHLDLHVRNIMKDDVGNFKLIDLERIDIGG